MRVWSKGLGKQALNINFAKCDVTREGDAVVIRGILRNGGTIWDARVTFTKEDMPGLIYFALSFAMLRHLIRNIAGVFTFVRDRFLLRRMGLKPKESSK
ncbi:MAG: hypothetical protein KAT75_01665 [Dehalococcoidia bacterium]|nr:hypothetical protein [Dehalococcoidia bacterium]